MTTLTPQPVQPAVLIGWLKQNQIQISLAILWLIWLTYLRSELTHVALRDLDWMFLTGTAAFLMTTTISLALERVFAYCMRKFAEKGSLNADAHELLYIVNTAKTLSWRRAFVGGRITVAVEILVLVTAVGIVYFRDGTTVFLQYVWRDHGVLFSPFIDLTIVALVCCWVAGLRLGMISAYGVLDRILNVSGANWTVLPKHQDGLGGTKYVGIFISCSAFLTVVPVLWTTAWFLLIPHWHKVNPDMAEGYVFWRYPILFIFGLGLWFFGLSVLKPVFRFHHAMEGKAEKYSMARDALRKEIAELRATEGVAAAAELSKKLEELDLFESIATWPIKFSRIAIWAMPHLLGILFTVLGLTKAEEWVKFVFTD